MKKVTVLGAGLVGSAIAADLSGKYDVLAVDSNREQLKELQKIYKFDVSSADFTDKKQLYDVISDSSLVIGAAPGYLGFNVVKNVIEAGKDIVDISFFPEDYSYLEDVALKNDVTAIIDCGLAPGMPNIILGYHNELMEVKEFDFIVGGLPFERKFPWQYKAPFSPVDVLEEYTRPARFMENGRIVTKPALSDPELIYFKYIGTLEAFNTDGLRSLLKTMKHIPYMKEKTLRYPGHIALVRSLLDSGFFSNEEILINGNPVKPIEFASKLLFDEWKLNSVDDEFTIMRVNIKGIEQGVEKKYTYNLYDRRDFSIGFSSMARTTGFTACAAATLILEGKFSQKGVIPPEGIGKNQDYFDHILNYLSARNVIYHKLEKIL